MHVDTRHHRHLWLILLLALLALFLLVRPAHAAWSADPVEVHATTALCQLVAASDDSHHGAIVVWQENTATGGLLRAMHLLASGDLDPAWSAPAAVSGTDVARAALGAVTDGAGGAYVWWMQSGQLFLTRVDAAGAIAAGWPANGRNIGLLPINRNRPSIAADGTGGIYMAWAGATAGVRAVHLGPANTGAGGWPNGIRVLGATTDAVELANTAAIAAAPDGGLWLAFGTTTLVDPDVLPGDLRVLRLTSAGLPAAGWDAHGVSLGTFRGDLLSSSVNWGPVPAMSLVAIANDGGSGAYLLSADVAGDPSGASLPGYRLVRIASDGTPAPGWPAGGVATPNTGFVPDRDFGAGASLRALADDRGGVFAGTPGFYSEGISVLSFDHRSDLAIALPGGLTADQLGLEVASRGDGGMYAASFFPSGPTSMWSPNAYVAVAQSAPGTGYSEFHDTPVVLWYGDVGLTATGDGGAIFVWSQVNERYGVFALRLGPAGLVTAVPPVLTTQGPPTLRLRFVPGLGVRALLSSVPAGREEVTLVDVAGRRLSSTVEASAAGGDWLLPGTAELPSGVYFARAVVGGRLLEARVAVVR